MSSCTTSGERYSRVPLRRESATPHPSKGPRPNPSEPHHPTPLKRHPSLWETEPRRPPPNPGRLARQPAQPRHTPARLARPCTAPSEGTGPSTPFVRQMAAFNGQARARPAIPGPSLPGPVRAPPQGNAIPGECHPVTEWLYYLDCCIQSVPVSLHSGTCTLIFFYCLHVYHE